MSRYGQQDWGDSPAECSPGFTVIVYRDELELTERTFDEERDAINAAAELLADARYPWPTRAAVYHEDQICHEEVSDGEWQHAEWPDHAVQVAA